MYLTLVILAAVGVLLAALSALTALVRSIAEGGNNPMHNLGQRPWQALSRHG